MAERNAEHGFDTVYWSEGKNRRDQIFISKVDTLGNFILRCTRHRMTDETPEQYAAMTKEQRGDAKDVGGFVGGVFKDNKRGNDFLQKRTMLTLDLDQGKYDPAEVLTRTHERLGGCAVIGYTSHSHTPQEPRIRLVIPLAKPITEMSVFARLVSTVIERCALKDYTDECSTRPAQLFYWPSAPKGAAVWAGHRMGPLFDPAKHLPKSIAPVETRSAMADQHPSTATVLTPDSYAAPRLGDPRQKAGLIGAFCRAWYPITRAIDELLSGVYVKSGRGRYRYYQSDSEGGLIIKDGGLHAFSNHTNTDPAADGHSHNAYDLVRIHLFGGDEGKMRDFASKDPATIKELFPVLKDEDVEVEVEVSKKPDRKKATSGETDLMEAETAFNADISSYVRPSGHGPYGTSLTKANLVANTPTNARLLMENDRHLRGRIQFNQMSGLPEAMPGLPWFKRVHPDDDEAVSWGDSDMKHLAMYLSDAYGFVGKPNLQIALDYISHFKAYHPIRDYFATLEWDGVPRLETAVIDHLGAEDNPCTRQMTELFIVGAVARVYKPGVKFDYMTIFQGPQGSYKSTFCRIMGGKWYVDGLKLNDSKDIYMNIRGRLIGEWAEMSGMNKASTNDVKDFLTRQTDIFRCPYAEFSTEQPRQIVFAGTINDDYFLKDDTNRRFSVIRIIPELRKYEDPSVSLEEVRDQIWAEAVHRYRTQWEGKPLVLSKENAEEQSRRNDKVHMNNIDPVRLAIEDYVTREIPISWDSYSIHDRTNFYRYAKATTKEERLIRRTTFCLKGFLSDYFGCPSELEAKRKDKSLAGDLRKRVSNYLKEFGQWEKAGRKRTVYGLAEVYERTDNPYLEDDDL